MITINGPIRIDRGKELDMSVLKKCDVKLPFTATGFRCTKNMDLIPSEMKKKVKVEVVADIKVDEPTPTLTPTAKPVGGTGGTDKKPKKQGIKKVTKRKVSRVTEHAAY